MIALLASIDPAWIALIGTLFGGVGLKVTERWLGKNRARIEDRKDYRDEIRELHDRLNSVEAELDDWREKYYRAQETILELKALVYKHKQGPD